MASAEADRASRAGQRRVARPTPRAPKAASPTRSTHEAAPKRRAASLHALLPPAVALDRGTGQVLHDLRVSVAAGGADVDPAGGDEAHLAPAPAHGGGQRGGDLHRPLERLAKMGGRAGVEE